MSSCDVCGGFTTWEQGTAYTADEFRIIVHMGFEPPTAVTRLGQAAIQGWKTGLVANSTTGWLLCPSCAQRAAKFLPKIPGTGPAGQKLFETMTKETLFGLNQLKSEATSRSESPEQRVTASSLRHSAEILRTPNKTCPTCNNEITAETTDCPVCNAQFEVVIQGYCATEHSLMDCDIEGKCLECHQSIIDKRVESTLLRVGTPPLTEPTLEEDQEEIPEDAKRDEPYPVGEVVSTYKCPMCAEIIKTEARLCRFCGARFDVSVKGYCVRCHQLVEVGANNRCSICGGDLVDIRQVSRLIEDAFPGSSTPKHVIPTKSSIPYTSNGLLTLSPDQERPGCVTVYAVFLWFGSAVIALSAILSFIYSPTDISGGPITVVSLLGMAFLFSAVGIGLWQLKNWARVTLLILLGLGILLNLIMTFSAVFAPESLGEYGSQQTSAIICGFLFVSAIYIWMITWFIRNGRYFRHRI